MEASNPLSVRKNGTDSQIAGKKRAINWFTIDNKTAYSYVQKCRVFFHKQFIWQIQVVDLFRTYW